MEIDPVNIRGMLYVIVTNKSYLLKLLIYIYIYLIHSFWHSAGELNYCKNFKLIEL